MRLIFGPAKGYTTSIWDFFNGDDNYYTNSKKTLGLPELRDELEEEKLFSPELYIENYEFDKPYIDCSLLYFNETDYFKRQHEKLNVFDETKIVYNIRNLKQIIFSFYYMARRDFSLFKNNTELLHFLFERYDLRNFLNFYNLYKNDTFDLYFIQDFNIDEIVKFFNLKSINKKFNHLNFGWYEHKHNSKLKIPYIDIFKEFELLIAQNSEKYIEILESNIDIINKSNLIGRFDKEKYENT